MSPELKRGRLDQDGDTDNILDFLACPIVPDAKDILPQEYRKRLSEKAGRRSRTIKSPLKPQKVVNRFFPPLALRMASLEHGLTSPRNSVFNIPVYNIQTVPPKMPFQVGGRITHPAFGGGRVTHIFAVQTETVILRVLFDQGETRLIDSSVLLARSC